MTQTATTYAVANAGKIVRVTVEADAGPLTETDAAVAAGLAKLACLKMNTDREEN